MGSGFYKTVLLAVVLFEVITAMTRMYWKTPQNNFGIFSSAFHSIPLECACMLFIVISTVDDIFSKFGCSYKNHRHIHAITIVYAHGKISVRFAHINTRWTVSNRSNVLVKLDHTTDPNHRPEILTLQEANFYWNLDFAISRMATKLHLNSLILRFLQIF